MILRRLTEHVKAQNWFAVAIDFVIVVLGVFIGIQVANWNQRMADQRRADELFVRLIDDISNERQIVSAAVTYYQTTVAYAKTALQGFEAPESVANETFIVSAYQASQWLAPSTSRSTFEELVATGALSLVRDEKVRALLIGYYEFDWTRSALVSERPAYREAIRGILPFELQEAVLAACGDKYVPAGRTILVVLPTSCDIDAAPEDIELAAARLRAAPGLEQALRFQLSENASKAGAFLSFRQGLDALIAAIEADAP